jgi:hypothetical protein
MFVSLAAHAAQSITFTPFAIDGSFSDVHQHRGDLPDLFDAFSFALPSRGYMNVPASIGLTTTDNNIDLWSVLFAGHAFDVTRSAKYEIRDLPRDSRNPGLPALTIIGNDVGCAGSCLGILAFSTSQAPS